MTRFEQRSEEKDVSEEKAMLLQKEVDDLKDRLTTARSQVSFSITNFYFRVREKHFKWFHHNKMKKDVFLLDSLVFFFNIKGTTLQMQVSRFFLMGGSVL